MELRKANKDDTGQTHDVEIAGNATARSVYSLTWQSVETEFPRQANGAGESPLRVRLLHKSRRVPGKNDADNKLINWST
jgi:hypothetical protein